MEKKTYYVQDDSQILAVEPSLSAARKEFKARVGEGYKSLRLTDDLNGPVIEEELVWSHAEEASKSAAVLGSIRTERKAAVAASRENGKKGGRPESEAGYARRMARHAMNDETLSIMCRAVAAGIAKYGIKKVRELAKNDRKILSSEIDAQDVENYYDLIKKMVY